MPLAQSYALETEQELARCDIRIDLPCTVRVVRSEADFEKAMDVRRRGYSRILPLGAPVQDQYDRLPNCFILLAEDLNGNPVGTGRLLQRPQGPVETSTYVDLSQDPGLDECLEGTKFSIPPFQGSVMTKLAIWKAGFLLALSLQSPTLMVNVRPSAKRDYEALLFEATGISFIHPLDSQARAHTVMRLDLTTARQRYALHGHKLHDFFFVQKHPQIRLFD